MGAGHAGHRGRARAGPGARHARRWTETGRRRRTGGRGDRRVVGGAERLRARAGRKADGRQGGDDHAVGARARRVPAGRGDHRRRPAGADQRSVPGRGGECVERARRQRGPARRRLLHTADKRRSGTAVNGDEFSRQSCGGPSLRAAFADSGAARRRCESGVRHAACVARARGVREDSVHRELRQLPRRNEHPGRCDPSRPFVPGVVDRCEVRIRGDGRGGERRATGHAAAASDARDARRAARGRPAAATSTQSDVADLRRHAA